MKFDVLLTGVGERAVCTQICPKATKYEEKILALFLGLSNHRGPA